MKYLVITAERQVFYEYGITEDMEAKASEGLLIIVSLVDETYNVDNVEHDIVRYKE